MFVGACKNYSNIEQGHPCMEVIYGSPKGLTYLRVYYSNFISTSLNFVRITSIAHSSMVQFHFHCTLPLNLPLYAFISIVCFHFHCTLSLPLYSAILHVPSEVYSLFTRSFQDTNVTLRTEAMSYNVKSCSLRSVDSCHAVVFKLLRC